ncbi:ABC transporter ATP-binding protein [Paenibacillus yanchengensis]|uniref:ABC transporter ATP-binding protein n=1 Tax=Paenibacillus yanchengensis TaxID=2035833 RepID=A0ABW4YNX9_9BACL
MLALLKHLKPYRTFVIAVLLMMFAGIMLELYLPTLMAGLVDNGIAKSDINYVWRTGGIMLVCTILAVGLTIFVTYLSSRITQGFSRDVRRMLFTHVEGLSMEQFDRLGTASLITRTTNDIRQVQDVISMMLSMMTRAPIMLIGGIILALSRDVTLSIVFLVTLPVLAIIIFFVTRKVIPLFSVLQKKTDRLNLLLRESLIGTRVVRAFNRTQFEKDRFQTANEDYRDTGIRVNRILAVLYPIMMIAMNATSIMIVWFGAGRIDQGAMQVGNLMAFLQYAMMILMSLIMLSMAFVAIPRAQASAKRINEVFALQSAKQEVKSDIVLGEDVQQQGAVISFEQVSFRYAGAEKHALKDISFTAKPGQTTAIIGSTGSGKSTLLKLIPRFYDPEIGKITINGVATNLLDVDELRSLIGYIPQKASLFRGTIRHNLRFGNPHTTDQLEQQALEIAQATNFVNSKEKGILDEVSQGGGNLSGGQKQRLSIARALARQPLIYLFDDSFSALDYKTDAKLRAALKQVTEKSTVIIVAQRVNTIIDADQIIVLHDGEVAGTGTHEQLLKSNIIYQEIVQSQQMEEESV